MEIRHLRYFVVVVEEQSFTKAAEKLFIAQPPLSRQIQNLEEELGVQLIERGARPLKTTVAGQYFYQYAKKMLTSLEQMVSMTKKLTVPEDVLRIGFVGSLLFGLLPRIIYAFRQVHPHLKIEVLEISTQDQIEALKQGKIDVGFGRLKISDSSIKRTLLRHERLMVAVHTSHPLAKMKDTGVHLSDIVDELLLMYPNTTKPSFASHIMSLFNDHGLTPNRHREVREVQLALGIAASGEGVCIVPRSSMSIQLYNLVYIPLLDPDAVSPIFIAIRNLEENVYINSLFDTIHDIYQTVNPDT